MALYDWTTAAQANVYTEAANRKRICSFTPKRESRPSLLHCIREFEEVTLRELRVMTPLVSPKGGERFSSDPCQQTCKLALTAVKHVPTRSAGSKEPRCGRRRSS
jgi:hypothetical protein